MTDTEFNSKNDHFNALISCPDLVNLIETIKQNTTDIDGPLECIDQLKTKINSNKEKIKKLEKE